MKVAVIGLSPRSHHLAPWGDPEWELWGLAWDADFLKMTRTFEMHAMSILQARPGHDHYLRRLALCPSLYMHEAYPEVPNATRYPAEEIAAMAGDYFESSIGYMLAQAIYEGATEIMTPGVDMKAADEYESQRPNAEYFCGFARGRGIKVHIPESSPLCKPKAGRYGT